MPEERIWWRKMLHHPVMGTFNSNSEEQLNTCWSFISLECKVRKQLSWITKIEPEPMMEVSLELSVRQLHNRQNHLFLDFKLWKNLLWASNFNKKGLQKRCAFMNFQKFTRKFCRLFSWNSVYGVDANKY